jgi:uncharacterized membrane protein YfcA
MDELGRVAALLAAAFGAGVMNAIAGGGTILTFPTLVLMGMPAIQANATSTVSLVPASAASTVAYRREMAGSGPWLALLALPSLLGGGLGSLLLLSTPEELFARLAPFLVLFATVLFGVQAVLTRGDADDAIPSSRGRRAAAWMAQLLVSVYGGYFGAGMGILMLVVLRALGLRDLHAMNGLKNVLGACINGVAALWFVVRGAVDWPAALVLMVGASVGGYAGAGFARHIGRDKARRGVVVIGLLVTALLFAWQSRQG